MQKILYPGTTDFAELLMNVDGDVNIVGHFYAIRDLLSNLALYSGNYLDSIIMPNPDYMEDDDQDIYCLMLCSDGGIIVEPAYIDEEGLEFYEDDVVFVFEDVPDRFFEENKDATLIRIDYNYSKPTMVRFWM